MGCGASKLGGTRADPIESVRDPDDYGQEYIELTPSGIPEFDAVFSSIEEVLNKVVELNNDVNDGIADIKAAYAACVGALQVDAEVGVQDHDHVLLDVYRPDGMTRPDALEIQSNLRWSEAVKTADSDLEETRGLLHEALSGHATHVPLQISAQGLLVAEPLLPEVVAFNTALVALRTALGPAYRVTLAVKPSSAPKAPTVRAHVCKMPAGGLPDQVGRELASAVLEPATLLDVSSSDACARVKTAEAAVAARAKRLALKTRDLMAGGVRWQVLRRHKVTLTTLIVDAPQRAAVRRALVDMNAALFMLVSSAASSEGPATLSRAVGEIARQVCLVVRKKWEGRGGPPFSLKTMITVTPTLSFKAEGVFDFSLRVEAVDAAQLGAVPGCLPAHAQDLLGRFEALNNTVRTALASLPGLSNELDGLIEQAREFYELVPEAAAQRGMPMMEAVKAGKAVGHNLAALLAAQSLFRVFAANVKRVADDLAGSQAEVHRVIEQQTGEAGVGRTLT